MCSGFCVALGKHLGSTSSLSMAVPECPECFVAKLSGVVQLQAFHHQASLARTSPVPVWVCHTV